MRELMRSMLEASPSDRVSRLTLNCLVIIGLLLVLSASGLSGDDNDCDDDDSDSKCCGAAKRAVCCPSQTGPLVDYVCPKEYFGEVAGIHWYDAWTKPTTCTGRVVYVGHTEDVTHLGLGCSGGTCPSQFPWFVATRRKQPRFCTISEDVTLPPPTPRVHHSKRRNGYAVVTDPHRRTYYFKIFTIHSRYPGPTPHPDRVRHIGVEVNKNDEPRIPGPLRRAGTWHTIDNSRGNHVITVTTGSGDVDYVVTTKDVVP